MSTSTGSQSGAVDSELHAVRGAAEARDGVRKHFANPQAFLSRTDLRSLGLERRAGNAFFRASPVGEANLFGWLGAARIGA